MSQSKRLCEQLHMSTKSNKTHHHVLGLKPPKDLLRQRQLRTCIRIVSPGGQTTMESTGDLASQIATFRDLTMESHGQQTLITLSPVSKGQARSQTASCHRISPLAKSIQYLHPGIVTVITICELYPQIYTLDRRKMSIGQLKSRRGWHARTGREEKQGSGGSSGKWQGASSGAHCPRVVGCD